MDTSNFRLSLMLQDQHIATVCAIVQAINSRKQLGYYAMVPEHVFLRRRQICAPNENCNRIFLEESAKEEIIVRGYYIKSGIDGTEYDITSVLPSLHQHGRDALQDVAFCPIDQSQVLAERSAIFTHSVNCSIFDIGENCRGRRVFCAGKFGTTTARMKGGKYIRFKLDNDDSLQAADWGAPVHLADGCTKRREIIGMLSAASKQKPGSYSMTVLRENIQLAEKMLFLTSISMNEAQTSQQVHTSTQTHVEHALPSAVTSVATKVSQTESGHVPSQTKLESVTVSAVTQTDQLSESSSPIDFPDSIKKVLNYLNITGPGSDTINLPVTPVSDEIFREMNNSELAYRMSSPIRGRCLIINNRKFTGLRRLPVRYGSEKDVENILRVFGKLSIVCKVVQNLTTKKIEQAIKEETKREDHHEYGMFVLIIMSHGKEGKIAGRKNKFLELTKIYRMLSPAKFPAMAGKPKLMIVQACAGTYKDSMGSYTTDSLRRPNVHNYAPDDLFIAKASFSGYLALRHSQSGSLFIRALLVALCKYSHIMDFATLFTKLVRHAVQERSRKLGKRGSNKYGPQTPAPQNLSLKKLYLYARPDQAM